MTKKELVLSALRQYQGDDLYRARAAFRGLTPEQLNQPYGASGQTKAQILKDYERHDAAVKEAIEWVQSLRE